MQELERERKDRLAATARCYHCLSRPSRFPVLNVKLSPGLMCCSRGSLSCKSHAMKQTPEQVTYSLWLVTARSPHTSQQLPLPPSSLPPPQPLRRSRPLTRTTPPPPASFSCAPSSSRRHHQVQCHPRFPRFSVCFISNFALFPSHFCAQGP